MEMVGVGNDIVEIERIEAAIARYGNHFLDRLFTPKEQAYCAGQARPPRHYAGRFACKEAIAKALGTGIGAKLGWCDMEILSDPQGKPMVTLSPSLKHFEGISVTISISHCNSHATAVAVAYKD